MGHGIGCQKDMGLDVYATGFAEAGLAAVAFDYRTFGGSDGEPRHWVSPARHIEDIEAVVRHVQVGLGALLWVGREGWLIEGGVACRGRSD